MNQITVLQKVCDQERSLHLQQENEFASVSNHLKSQNDRFQIVSQQQETQIRELEELVVQKEKDNAK